MLPQFSPGVNLVLFVFFGIVEVPPWWDTQVRTSKNFDRYKTLSDDTFSRHFGHTGLDSKTVFNQTPPIFNTRICLAILNHRQIILWHTVSPHSLSPALHWIRQPSRRPVSSADMLLFNLLRAWDSFSCSQWTSVLASICRLYPETRTANCLMFTHQNENVNALLRQIFKEVWEKGRQCGVTSSKILLQLESSSTHSADASFSKALNPQWSWQQTDISVRMAEGNTLSGLVYIQLPPSTPDTVNWL